MMAQDLSTLLIVIIQIAQQDIVFVRLYVE